MCAKLMRIREGNVSFCPELSTIKLPVIRFRLRRSRFTLASTLRTEHSQRRNWGCRQLVRTYRIYVSKANQHAFKVMSAFKSFSFSYIVHVLIKLEGHNMLFVHDIFCILRGQLSL